MTKYDSTLNCFLSCFQDTLNLMKAEGWKFPPVREAEAMFEADIAPDWSDGEVCHRCRVQVQSFPFIKRPRYSFPAIRRPEFFIQFSLVQIGSVTFKFVY